MINLLLSTFSIVAMAETGAWTYENALTCLKSFSLVAGIKEQQVAFSRTNIGIAAGGYDNANGFFALAPVNAFFIPSAEGVKSGDGTTGESKMTIQFPAGESTPLKFFWRSDADGAVSFATANEFDRIVTVKEVPKEATETVLKSALGSLVQSCQEKWKGDPKGLSKAIEACEKTGLDFDIRADKGVDSTLRKEMARMKEKMKPSIFTKEYWLPKKEGAG